MRAVSASAFCFLNFLRFCFCFLLRDILYQYQLTPRASGSLYYLYLFLLFSAVKSLSLPPVHRCHHRTRPAATPVGRPAPITN
jgi:hypothetical protein